MVTNKKKNHIKILKIIVGIVIFFFLFGNKSFKNLLKKQYEYIILKKELKRLGIKKESLQKEIENLQNNPVYLEGLVREKLNMSKEGELVFKIKK